MGASTTSIFTNALAVQRKALAIWSVSVAAVCAMYAGMYPWMDEFDLESMMKAFPPAFIEALGYDQMGSAAGYLQSAVYGLVALALLLIFAIATGARLIAGEEEDGRLELEFTSPTPRGSIYVQRLAVLWTGISVLVGALFAVTELLNLVQGLEVVLGNLLAGTLQLWLIVGMYGTATFALGAATGRRGLALGAASGLAVAGWMFNAIGPTVDQDWMAAISPFGWYMRENALIEGLNPLGVALLLAVTVVCAVGGWLRFRARDLGT